MATVTDALRQHRLSGRNKLARAVWGIAWMLLCRPTPRPLHAWRCMIARLFGAKLGRGIRLYPSAKIWAPWNLVMADETCLGPDVDCYNVDTITLGAHSTVSQYSYLCTASHDYTRADMPLITAPITLGERVWITADVFVGPGVTIGDGAVVTARSSVFHDLPPWMVARGNPAVPVKARAFEESADGTS